MPRSGNAVELLLAAGVGHGRAHAGTSTGGTTRDRGLGTADEGPVTWQDPVSRYFGTIYPVMRGFRGPAIAGRIGRFVTEPGRERQLAWVVAHVDPSKPQRVLDAGCGEGAYAIALARLGHQVTAVDFSESMLLAARRCVEAAGVSERVRLVRADLRSWSSAESFDTVLCMGVAEYYPEAPQLLRDLMARARQQMLISLAKPEAGLRALVRRGWLRLHGLGTPSFGAEDLRVLLRTLPGVDSEVTETPWTCCAAIRRNEAAAMVSGAPAVAPARERASR